MKTIARRLHRLEETLGLLDKGPIAARNPEFQQTLSRRYGNFSMDGDPLALIYG